MVSTPYNTIDFVRTMEEVLGLPPMNLNDALATPMADIFNTTPSAWSFTATPSAFLYCTQSAAARPAPAVSNARPRTTRRTGRGSPRAWTSPMRIASMADNSTAFSGKG